MQPANKVAKVTVRLAFDKALVFKPEVIEQFGQVLVARITGKRDNPLFGNLLATIL